MKGDYLMKRFLGVLVASMFLASAAYAADAMKEEKAATKEEKKADSKATKEEKKADAKATKEEKKADAKVKADAKKADAKADDMKAEKSEKPSK